MNHSLIFSLFSVLIFGIACNGGPKVISAEEGNASQPASGIFSSPSTASSSSAPSPTAAAPSASLPEEVHRVVVHEVLPTEKYVYLKVTEGIEQFWIATRKQTVQPGEVYFYRGGLLKTNFESKEYQRVFDEIYLVSKLVSEQHGQAEGMTLPASIPAATAKGTTSPSSANAPAGSMTIAELLQDPSQYAGKTIQLHGTCVKINPSIMGRNWIHLQDGSKDDYDLVITSATPVQEGQVVTMQAVVALNKDFGAGYSYELILEEGKVVR